MQYQKPEVVQLGQATELILADKTNLGHETTEPFNRRLIIDCELDD